MIKITRKEALELANTIVEKHAIESHEYWMYFKGASVPFERCMHVLKEFIENPSLSNIEIPVYKK